jgi:hypothetical protein
MIILPRQARDKYRENSRKKEMRFLADPRQRHVQHSVLGRQAAGSEAAWPHGAKNATFCAAIYISKRTFYQDRLGTNLGKVEKRVAFLQDPIVNGMAQLKSEDNSQLTPSLYHYVIYINTDILYIYNITMRLKLIRINTRSIS